MSYIIDFYIDCPQHFPHELNPFHASIMLVEAPGQNTFFTYPGGCGGYHNCPSCTSCCRTIRQMFVSGAVSFYHDPRSLHSMIHQSLPTPVRPQFPSASSE